jgi:hypothetical protein
MVYGLAGLEGSKEFFCVTRIKSHCILILLRSPRVKFCMYVESLEQCLALEGTWKCCRCYILILVQFPIFALNETLNYEVTGKDLLKMLTRDLWWNATPEMGTRGCACGWCSLMKVKQKEWIQNARRE